MFMEENAPKTLVMGLGNVLMGDEGIGPRCADYLMDQSFPENVNVLDGGTGGFHLLSLFAEYDRFILIDASLTDMRPGEVRVIKPRFASDFPNSLTSHDIGLRDLMQSAELLGDLPQIDLIIVGIKEFQKVSMELSEELKEVLPLVHQKVLDILQADRDNA